MFARVVDNGRVLRTVFQMVRSGQFGRTSLSSSLLRAFQLWLNEASVGKLLSASIGNDPSLRDVLRLARPTPKDNARRALFGRLSGRIARQMGPQALRMNLNTLLRHEAFGQNGTDSEMVDYVAARIADEGEIRQSRPFPLYLAAYLNADDPQKIKTALHKAAEIACGNIPQLAGPVVIGLDVSGSMASPVTGHRGRGATTKMRCVDVAALFAAAILRRNPDSVVVPFDTQAYQARLDPNDSILSLAERLAKSLGTKLILF